MKIIVTHASPDLDAITSVWLIKKYLPGWNEARVEFVPAGQKKSQESRIKNQGEVIELYGNDEVIHVDTGLGPLDHHQTSNQTVSAASLTWDFVRNEHERVHEPLNDEHKENISKIVRLVVDIDHFKEVFWDNPTADYHEFSLIGILEGLKFQKPGEDDYYVEFVRECLDAVLHNFENRMWAEKEIENNGKKFETKWGKAIGFETINDTVIKLAQKMGFMIVVRKDPRKGYVRIKARPELVQSSKFKSDQIGFKVQSGGIDLTQVYERLKKMDPDATWFLHVSKKMLLNGTTKNPNMRPTKLSLQEIIDVLKRI